MTKSKEYYAKLSPSQAYCRARKIITCFAIALADNDTDKLGKARSKYLELLKNSSLCNEFGLTQDITQHLHLHMLSYDILEKIQ